MYDELVKSLRICSRCDFGQDCNGCTQKSDDEFCCDKLLHQAADAIEELERENERLHADLGKAIRWLAEEHAKQCPHYIRNVHDRGDDSLCDKYKCEVNALPRWIPVTERLPETMKDVVLFMRYGKYKQLSEFAVGYYDDKLSDFSYCDVTHWMPLPEPPKDGDA